MSASGQHSPLLADGPQIPVQEQVYERLRNVILSGALEPGQRLLQDELAAEMAVSPVQVREALLRLGGEGLADFQPYRGFTVATFTLDDLKEIYYLRSLLEGAASALASKNLTDRELDELAALCGKTEESLGQNDIACMPKYSTSFHEIIYLAAKSPRLYGMIVRLWNGFLKSSLSCLTLRARETVEEHKAIYRALKARNPEEARAKTQEYIGSVLRDIYEYWKDWINP